MIITERERLKYGKVWQLPGYSEKSPGADWVPLFMSMCKPLSRTRIIDVGSGGGAGSRALESMGLDVTAFDLNTPEDWNCSIPFDQGCVWRDLRGWGKAFDYAYCCDVLEHIPTQFVALAISEILSVAGKAFFSVSFRKDTHGAAVGEPLHLTVQSFTWWRDTFRELGIVHEARDLIGEGIFVVGE